MYLLFKSIPPELFYDQPEHIVQEEKMAITSHSSPVFLLWK
jgi:hypothetical protein